ncbi:2-C-methyl-D-erythritol 4-phosphate cytidylyltransferase [Pseudoalteromonas distincta]|uniref:2-C-methyl-D-erythritol 4-phosphate cytidylyltransferase n=1 Tax=Pseudoalteromonas distincta TaxID=77608 RepID=A0ABT9GI57_9GAMM|nr:MULTISPECIES: 2-C-methyl-D-erythritol 4-phosphate cytidylyltransferase [Pseudoalteromonas distincta group]KHM44590.1 2-C-methyl-D-erythritol 4-phosphate cytidylyltransferase [Pseudoalteromonas elyakovii]KID40017.1 2-C-methyl-D-erythritol 4-phosphate cytidylyltransferase [Pseudoalteromonas distincta]MDP4485572.1 2-C-methyl-D-erythritol 4-phosphate cytidylyltransferase [Pseudoalteromonas elyakovii]
MTNKQTIAAIVPAAGVGSRMQHNAPKQYIQLAGKTILEHTLAKLSQLPQLRTIVVALSDSDPYFDELPLLDNRIVRASGGKERADSVLNSLLFLAPNPPIWVLVHDAARPLVNISDIERLIDECINADEGGILASKVKDTIKRGHTHALQTVPRDDLWQALTPQFFKYDELKNALQNALASGATITDEASAIEWAGKPVKLVAGRSDNIKITTPEDLDLAGFLLHKQQNESGL